MPDLTPHINGQAYSWVDITVNILGIPLAGIMKIEYDENSEITNNYGAGRRPVSVGHGKIETTCSMSIDRAELNSLIRSAPNRNLIDIPEFDIIVAYLPENSTPVVDTIKNCRFKGTKGGASEGDSNVVAELDLNCSHIEWASN